MTMLSVSTYALERSMLNRPPNFFLFNISDTSTGALYSPWVKGNQSWHLWKDIQPDDEDHFDWTGPDAALAAARTKRKKWMPRIMTNADNVIQATPQWVFDAGAESWSPTSGQEISPLPWDPIYQAKLAILVNAFAERYGGEDDIELFQTNAGGGTYGEMYMGSNSPAGYSASLHTQAIKDVLDIWRDAFDGGQVLSLMCNYLGANVLTDAVAYAGDYTDSGAPIYLQTNSPVNLPSQLVDVFKQEAPRTRIIIEAENPGTGSCTKQTLATAWDTDVEDILFAYGFPVDYIVNCVNGFNDRDTARHFNEVTRYLMRTPAPPPLTGD